MSTYWNVDPRYSPGSPAALRDEQTLQRVMESERSGDKNALAGRYGEEAQKRAQRLGLRGIIVKMREKGKRWVCFDELTAEHYEQPFEDKMRKQGYGRWKDLDEAVQTLFSRCEPIIAIEAQRDERRYWFSTTLGALTFVKAPTFDWQNPKAPPGFVWKPQVEE